MPTRGWGISPGPYGPQGVEPTPPVDPQQEQQDIHAIKQKYVGEGNDPAVAESIQTFNLAPGVAIKFDDPSIVINSFICNVDSGTVKLWLDDHTPNVKDQPHLTLPSGGPAPQYMIGQQAGKIITVGNDPTSAVNAVGCLIVQRI